MNENIVKNQKDYIDAYNSTFLGKLMPTNNTNNLSQSIRYINSNRIKRFLQYLKYSVSYFLYFLKHLDIWFDAFRYRKLEKKTLAVAAIIKNEAPYIKEWVEFHLAAGVEIFYIFDNESTDNIFDLLQPYIQKRQIVYIRFPGKKVQFHAYNYALKITKGIVKWVAFIDADEFLHPVNGIDLKENLMQYDDYPAIGVNWVVYGTCNHKKKINGLLINNYRLTFKDTNNELNCRIKSIVQPTKVLFCHSPHCCIYKNGEFAVDEDKNEIIGDAIFVPNSSMTCTMVNHRAVFRINHYWTKSEEELKIKCNRGYPDGHPNPEFEKILKRLDYPMVEDVDSVKPFLKKIIDLEVK